MRKITRTLNKVKCGAYVFNETSKEIELKEFYSYDGIENDTLDSLLMPGEHVVQLVAHQVGEVTAWCPLLDFIKIANIKE